MPEIVPPPGGYSETTAQETVAEATETIDTGAGMADNAQAGMGTKRPGEVGAEGKPSKKAKAERKGKKSDLQAT